MYIVQFYRFKWWSMLPWWYRAIHGCLENADLRITNNNNDAKVIRVTVAVHALTDSLIVATLHVQCRYYC